MVSYNLKMQGENCLTRSFCHFCKKPKKDTGRVKRRFLEDSRVPVKPLNWQFFPGRLDETTCGANLATLGTRRPKKRKSDGKKNGSPDRFSMIQAVFWWGHGSNFHELYFCEQCRPSLLFHTIFSSHTHRPSSNAFFFTQPSGFPRMFCSGSTRGDDIRRDLEIPRKQVI